MVADDHLKTVILSFGTPRPENHILGLDKTEPNDKLQPSDECPRDDESPLGLTAENKCNFRGQHRNQENGRDNPFKHCREREADFPNQGIGLYQKRLKTQFNEPI